MELARLSRLLPQERVDFAIHPDYLGYRYRGDGWGETAWHHDAHQVCYLVQSGIIRLRVAGQEYQIGAGTAALLAASLVPDIRFTQELHYHEVWFRLHAGRPVETTPSLVVVPDAWDLVVAIDGLATTEEADAADRLVQRHWLGLLLAKLHQLHLRRPRASGGLGMAQRLAITRFVRAHLSHQPTPADLAQVVGLSSDYFSRVFTRTYGVSPRRWIVQERMRAAARLLRETAAPVQEVAEQLGYASHSHFARQFGRMYRCSPRAYRAR